MATDDEYKDICKQLDCYNISDSISYFKKVSGKTIKEISRYYPDWVNWDDRQNGSPTLKKFVDFSIKHPQFLLSGYVIPATRHDYRITVDGIESTGESNEDENDLLNRFLKDARKPDDVWYIGDDTAGAWWD